MGVPKRKLQEIRKQNRNLFAEVSKNRTSYYEDHNERPYNPDELYKKDGNYTLYDEMRDDDTINGLLHLKKLIVLDNNWDIVSEDEEVRSFLIKAISGIHRGYDKKIYDILTSLDYGFSFSEKIWKLEDRYIVPKDIKTRPPHGWIFHQDEYGHIATVQQYADSGDMWFKGKQLKKFIHYTNQEEFDNPYGKSDLNRGVYHSYWSKKNIRNFWNIFLERHGTPTAVGTYPTKFYDQKEKLKTVLKNMQAKTGIAVPEGVKIELLKAHNEGEAFKLALEYYERSIARKMLIPDLMGLGGESIGGGSYALGREHFGIFYTVIEQERQELELMTNRELIEPMLKMNFGDKAEAKFEFTKADEKRKESAMKIWLEFIEAGGPFSDESVEWFYQNIEAPAPERGAPDSGIKVLPKQTGGWDKAPQTGEPEAKMTYADTGDMGKALDGLEAKHGRIIEKLMMAGIDDTIKQGEKIAKKGDLSKLEDLDGFGRSGAKKLQKAVVAMMREAFDEGEETMKFDLETTKDVGDWMKAYAFLIMDAELMAIRTAARPIIADGIRQGLTTNEMVKQMREKLPDMAKNRATNIVRTTISKSFNEARLRGYESMGNKVKGYEYLAIMDQRTSAFCQALDGNVYRPEDARAINPPNHFQCRSTLQAVFTEPEKYADIPGGYSQAGDFWSPKK